jgi:hypothetical protein
MHNRGDIVDKLVAFFSVEKVCDNDFHRQTAAAVQVRGLDLHVLFVKVAADMLSEITAGACEEYFAHILISGDL